MQAEVISYMLSRENNYRRLQFQIIYQCAPFLKGIKAACMISLTIASSKELNSIFDGTELEYRVLAEQAERCLVLFYDENKLKEYLEKEEVRQFLVGFGYRLQNVEKVLSKLSERIRRYWDGSIEFPHEIGVFLEYPIEDVMCFIQESGRNSLMNGYWKVYHNPGKAQMTFCVYDKARVNAVNEFLMGKSVRDIVCNG